MDTATVAAAEGSMLEKMISFAPLLLILFLILYVVIYFIPTYIAVKRKHYQKVAIILLNIFLGWSFVGWVIALVWSVTKERNDSAQRLKHY